MDGPVCMKRGILGVGSALGESGANSTRSSLEGLDVDFAGLAWSILSLSGTLRGF